MASAYSVSNKPPPDSPSARDYKRGYAAAAIKRPSYSTEEINAFLKDRRFNLSATDPYNCGYRDGLAGKVSKYVG